MSHGTLFLLSGVDYLRDCLVDARVIAAIGGGPFSRFKQKASRRVQIARVGGPFRKQIPGKRIKGIARGRLFDHFAGTPTVVQAMAQKSSVDIGSIPECCWNRPLGCRLNGSTQALLVQDAVSVESLACQKNERVDGEVTENPSFANGLEHPVGVVAGAAVARTVRVIRGRTRR